MAEDIRDPTGDTGTGADITVIGTLRHRTARYSVADVVEVETGITEEAAVRKGAMVQKQTPPTKTGRKLGAEDRLVAKEVGRRRRNDGLGDGEKSVRSAIGAHRIDGETSVRSSIGAHRRWGKFMRSAIGAHRTVVRPNIAALTVTSSIGTHKILARPAIAALIGRPTITALTEY